MDTPREVISKLKKGSRKMKTNGERNSSLNIIGFYHRNTSKIWGFNYHVSYKIFENGRIIEVK